MKHHGDAIRGKVARVLNSRELVLNVGADDGVEKGMRFNILDPKGQDIRDPDTDEVLGSIERPKIQVEVNMVEARLSVAATLSVGKRNVGGVGSAAMADVGLLFTPPHWVTAYESLRLEDHELEELDEDESLVKVGDPVLQVSRTLDEQQP